MTITKEDVQKFDDTIKFLEDKDQYKAALTAKKFKKCFNETKRINEQLEAVLNQLKLQSTNEYNIEMLIDDIELILNKD